MKFHSHSTFSDEEVQSGSATGFSDGEPREESAKAALRMHNAFDPVTQILDKIDAELVSLTRSQGSSSTATTGTDNTVIRRPNSRQSHESSRLENGEGLSLSQLGANYKPSVSLQSEQDTGIGTSSLHDNSLQHRSLEPEIRPLEPGDSFKDDMRGHHRRSATAPEMMFLNGHHMSDDDKQKRENQTASPFEAKHVDDKFKEILQKRKGGALRNADEDTQTIRTEDFVDKFQDTLVYSSADEAEKLRNIEDDLHSDGGSDTDTLQRKLAILTRTPIHNINNARDGGTRPRPLIDRPKRKLASSLEIRPRKAAGPGTPPVYPKPTHTTSLPRPSARSALKLTPGHVSDADSVRTEDFEYKFKDMMVNPGKKEESDLESVSNDPIHTKVKQLLKATAKYKPKSDYKTKQHVRISPQPVQYQDDDKGEDSDDTLCSDKHATVSSYRSWLPWDPATSGWGGLSDSYSRQWLDLHHPSLSKSSSLEDSWSKSSSLSHSSFSSNEKHHLPNSKPGKVDNIAFLTDSKGFSRQTSSSLSQQSSFNSSDKEKYQSHNKPGTVGSNISSSFLTDNREFSRQTSQVSNATSLPSWSGSDLPNTSAGASRSTSTGESMFDDVAVSFQDQNLDKDCFKDYQYSDVVGPTRRRSSLSESLSCGPYLTKKSGEDTMKTNKEKRKHRDIIIQEDEEEAYPFAKYTFNKKTEKSKADDSTSTLSSMSTKSSSQESIFSVGLMKQYVTLKNSKVPVMNKQSSSSSMISSLTSSFTDPNTHSMSVEDNSQDFESVNQDWRMRNSKMRYQKSTPNLFLNIPPPPMQNPYSYPMYNFPQMPAPEQLLNSMGLDEARSILPDRFLKSWIEKAMLTQQEEYMRCMMTASPQMSSAGPSYYDSPYYVDDSDLPPSVSAQQSVATTPQYRSSLENIYGVAKLFPQPQSSMRERKHLHRSHTFNSGSQNFSRSRTNSFISNEDDESDLAQIGALPLQKENSFDKLKRILQTSNPVHYKEKNHRRSMFASSHQKSLPICLETLTEEDEEKKRSRTPSFEYVTNKSSKASKMKSFLDEEERRYQATSSDNNSDFSSLSSASGNFEPPAPSIKEDCICSELGKKCTCSPNNGKTKEKSLKDESLLISIPSIVVSEREIDSGESNDAQKKKDFNELYIETKLEPSLPRIVEETCSPTNSEKMRMCRPASPNPDNQDEHCTSGSRHNSEIAAIMGNKSSTDFRKYVKKERTLKDFEQMQTEWSFPKSGHFLSISSADLDEKHLSPASSVASPNIMSPVTVIEVNKLDNQNDSLELDEVKPTENKTVGHNSSGTVESNNKSHVGLQKEIKFDARQDSVSQQNSQKRKKTKKFKAPKCLKLKRHVNDCDNLSGKDSTSDSENVFDERKSDIARNEYKSDEVQADDDSLAPIITVSDVSALLQRLTQSLPQLVREPLFFLAHDRGTQCSILSAATSIKDSTNNVDTQEEKQVVDDDSLGDKNISVPFDFEEIENNSLEKNHYEDVVDSFSQTDKTDFNIEENDLLLQTISSGILTGDTKLFSQESKFLTIKEVVIGTSDDLEESATTPDVFKSEKSFSLKQIEPNFKIKPCIINNRNTLSSHTSYLKVPSAVKEESTCEVTCGGKLASKDDDQVSFELTFSQFRQESMQWSSSVDLAESVYIIKDYGNNLEYPKQENVEDNKFQSDKNVEMSKTSTKIENAEQSKKRTENDNVMLGKMHESCVKDEDFMDKPNKTFENGQMVENDLLEKEISKKERNISFVHLNIASLLPNSDLSDNMEDDSSSVNENSMKTANVIPKENLEQSKGGNIQGSTRNNYLKSSFKTSESQNNVQENGMYIEEDKNELVELKNEMTLESEKGDIADTRLYHTECTVYPDISLEGFEKGKNKTLTSRLKDSYTSSIFFELKNSKFDKEVIDVQTNGNGMQVISPAGSSEERHILESENRSVCLKCRNDFFIKGVQNSIRSDVCVNCAYESKHRNDEGESKQEISSKLDVLTLLTNLVKNEPDKMNVSGWDTDGQIRFDISPKSNSEEYFDEDRCNSDDNFNATQNEKNSLAKENIDEKQVESKSKGKKGNLLRKFRALIGNRIDEVENTHTSSTEDMADSEYGDAKTQVISFRSLDFETIGSRKNILHRCLKTGFAKSFDIGGLDSKVEENTDAENQTLNLKTYSFDDKILQDSATENEIKSPNHTDATENEKQSPNHTDATENEKQSPIHTDSEFEIQDFYHADECNKVMYQVGLNYNDEQECFDVFGRVKVYRDSDESEYNNGNYGGDDSEGHIPEMDGVFDLTESDVMELINREMQSVPSFESPVDQVITELNRKREESENILSNDKDVNSADNKNGNFIHIVNQVAKRDTRAVKGAWRRKVFDMFQQVVDDDVDLIPQDNEASITEYSDDKNTNDNDDGHIVVVDDDMTRKTLEKIEKLYSLSVYDESHIPENLELEMSGDENLYENGNYLDQEMRHLDLYDTDEYGLTETHVCKNCGHSVTMESVDRYEHEEIIKHDFCSKCSPLKFSVEMLEKRRVQRMVQDDHTCN